MCFNPRPLTLVNCIQSQRLQRQHCIVPLWHSGPPVSGDDLRDKSVRKNNEGGENGNGNESFISLLRTSSFNKTLLKHRPNFLSLKVLHYGTFIDPAIQAHCFAARRRSLEVRVESTAMPILRQTLMSVSFYYVFRRLKMPSLLGKHYKNRSGTRS